MLFALVGANNIVYAQRTVSLRQFEAIRNAYRSSPDPIAEGLDEGDDITYVQDVNNELNQFVGTWKGTYNNKNYEFTFIKHTAFKYEVTDDISFDLLTALVIVKDNANNLIYTNANKSGVKGFSGSNFQGTTNIYTLNFTGNCYNESGTVYIRIRSDGKMTLGFAIMPDIQSNDCPNGFTPVLPLSPNGIILIKQP